MPNARFVVLEDGLTQDRLTGLVWQQLISDSDMPWKQAQSYCATAGSGFRLPSIRELATLINPTIGSTESPVDTSLFPNLPASPDTGFWSSTPYASYPSEAAWVVYLGGESGTAAPTVDQRFRAWCVR
jgi:hypothetical protein